MKQPNQLIRACSFAAALFAGAAASQAAPTVSRLTPPSALFTFGDAAPPIIARFLPGQRFDLQATVNNDPGQTLTAAQFTVDNVVVPGAVTLTPSGFVTTIAVTNGGSGYTTAPVVAIGGGGGATATAVIDGSGTVIAINVVRPGAGYTAIPAITFTGGGGTGATATAAVSFNKTVATLRAYSNATAGVHTLGFSATQSDAQSTALAQGNFEVVGITQQGRKAKNIIFMIGDGMGASHRTAARIMAQGVQQGKANALLAMDKFPFTGLVMTASLNSIVCDSAPGASCYSTGNKGNNNQLNVFPDDTAALFDNPRVETIGEYLARTQNKSLGIVTTSDVFDATPAAFGPHSQARSAGTGICDQYLDEMVPKANLKVLLGGGRKWFLPKNASPNGSARSNANDSVLPADLATAWGVPVGALDQGRDLLGDFVAGGFTYTPDKTSLLALPATADKLIGLFSLSNMNVAKDKIDGRRAASTVVNDYGFPDQPMLDEMTDKALSVLNKNPNGFVLMVEGASIDKQAHNMDTERWILDTIEFDNAVEKTRQFQAANPDTLVIVTADHECGGIAIIGGSTLTNAQLQARAATGGGQAQLRDAIVGTGTPAAPQFPRVVGTYEDAGFPQYAIAGDGYPVTTDVDFRMLIGYASNADRYEDWLTNAQPAHDSQQPFDAVAPLSTYPRIFTNDNVGAVNNARPVRDASPGNFFITGQVADTVAAHTGGDIPVSALGRGAKFFTGVMDNTDVFFKAMQAAIGGAAN